MEPSQSVFFDASTLKKKLKEDLCKDRLPSYFVVLSLLALTSVSDEESYNVSDYYRTEGFCRNLSPKYENSRVCCADTTYNLINAMLRSTGREKSHLRNHHFHDPGVQCSLDRSLPRSLIAVDLGCCHVANNVNHRH